jgi:GTPase
MILIFNKIDAFSYSKKDSDDLTPVTKDNFSLDDLKKTWMAADKSHRTVFISATDKENIDELRSILYEEVRRIHTIRYPYNNFLYPDNSD